MKKRTQPPKAYKNKASVDTLFDGFMATAKSQCLFVQKAIARFAEYEKCADMYFDEDSAARMINFASLFKHFEGAYAGRPFELQPFQKFIFGNIFGWKWKENKRRVITHADIFIPRKNGKTMLASLPAGYGIAGDRESGAQIYTVATKEEQAKICWRNVKLLFNSNRKYAKKFKFRTKAIESDKYHSFLKPLGSDSKTLDGLNPHFVINDELHKWRDTHLWDVLRGGMGARTQPLMLAISTFGQDQSETSICWQQYNHAKNVLNSLVEDFKFFPIMYTPDDGDDVFDPAVQAKVNPLLGKGKEWRYMREMESNAKVYPSAMNDFLNQQMNIWTQAASYWISPESWDACAVKDLPNLWGKRCYGGLDLAQVSDFTAFVLIFPKQDGLDKNFALSYFFIPQESAKKIEDKYKFPLREWEKRGHCFIWPEKIIRLTRVADFISSLKEKFEIRKIFYDRASAREVETILKERGFDIEPSFQGFRLSKDINKVEELVSTMQLAHDGNECLRMCILNAVVKHNNFEEKMLVKPAYMLKIDGAVSLCMAAGAMTVCEIIAPQKPKRYATA